MAYNKTLWNKKFPLESDKSYRYSYTKVIYEVPISFLVADFIYYGNHFITDLATNNIFESYKEFIDESLNVYIDNVRIEDVIIDPDGNGSNVKFEIPATNPDGHLYISYIPLYDNVGDQTNQFSGSRSTAAVRSLDFSYSYIEEFRKAINDIELYLDIIPTMWVNQDIKGDYHIIPGITRFDRAHLSQLQLAINAIATYFNNHPDFPIGYNNYEFTSIDTSDILMVQYIEEVAMYINDIEQTIIDKNL